MDNVGLFIAGILITAMVAAACWLVYKGFVADYEAYTALDDEAEALGAYEKDSATGQSGKTVEVESAGARAGRR